MSVERKMGIIQQANNELKQAYTLWEQSNRRLLLETLTPLIDFSLSSVKSQFNMAKLKALKENIQELDDGSTEGTELFIKNPYVSPCQFYDMIENMIIESVEAGIPQLDYDNTIEEEVKSTLQAGKAHIKTISTRLLNELETRDSTIIDKLKSVLEPLQNYPVTLFDGEKVDCNYVAVENALDPIIEGINDILEYVHEGPNTTPLHSMWKIYHNYFLAMIITTCNRLNQ